jgi:uncharacterized protein (TIGR03067 family)
MRNKSKMTMSKVQNVNSYTSSFNRAAKQVLGFRILCFFVALSVLLPSPSFADDREALVGTWQITVFQDDGRDRLERLGAGPAKKGQDPRMAKLMFTADECYLIRGDGRREMASGLTNAGWKSYQLDESTTPKSIDIVGFTGKDGEKTKTYLGIYKLDGDMLTICYCEQGRTRPTKFESDGAMNLFACKHLSKEPLPAPK